jgi:hypothetical protein
MEILTIRQKVGQHFGIGKTRVSQLCREGMPLTSAREAVQWVDKKVRVRNWGRPYSEEGQKIRPEHPRKKLSASKP